VLVFRPLLPPGVDEIPFRHPLPRPCFFVTIPLCQPLLPANERPLRHALPLPLCGVFSLRAFKISACGFMFVSLTFLNFWREMSYQKKLATQLRAKKSKNPFCAKKSKGFFIFLARKRFINLHWASTKWYDIPSHRTSHKLGWVFENKERKKEMNRLF